MVFYLILIILITIVNMKTKTIYFLAFKCGNGIIYYAKKLGRKFNVTPNFPNCTIFNSFDDAADFRLQSGIEADEFKVVPVVIDCPYE